jgi:hypothetical protein
VETFNRRQNRDAGSIDQTIGRLLKLATIDPVVAEHIEGLADYHDSEAATAYPIFHLDDIAHLVPEIVADHPQLASVLDYVSTADSDVVAVIMAGIRERIDQLIEGTAAR